MQPTVKYYGFCLCAVLSSLENTCKLVEPVVSVIKQVTLVLFGSRIQSNLLLSGGSFYFPMYSFFFLCVVKAIIR